MLAPQVAWLNPWSMLTGGMAESMIHAREVLMRPGGLVLPDRAELYVAGRHRGWWWWGTAELYVGGMKVCVCEGGGCYC